MLGFVVSTVAACGGGTGATPDSQGGDDVDAAALPVDAPRLAPDAQASTAVTVSVADNSGVPQSGLSVAFLGPTGNTISVAVTDTNGFASANMPDGGSVTVGAAHVIATGTDTNPTVFTWLDVKGGDNLVIGAPVPTTPPVPFDVNLTIPGLTNGVSFNVFSNCSVNPGDAVTTNSTAATITVNGCSTIDILIVAVDNIGTHNSLFKQNVAVVDGTPVTITGSYTPFTGTPVRLTNVPSLIATVASSVQQVEAATTIVLGAPATNTLSVEGGLATAQAQLANITSLADIATFTPSSTDATIQQTITTRVTQGSNISLDLGNSLLPAIDAAATYDLASNTLTWVEDGGIVAPTTSLESITVADGGTRSFEWAIVDAHSGLTITFPTLPTQLEQFNILDTDNVTSEFSGIAYFPGGYDGQRAQLFSATPLVVQHVGDVEGLSSFLGSLRN